MKVLMVVTSHDQLGNTGRKTGFWLEELAAPYFVFKDAGAEITLASPKGGRPPLDPKSNEPEFRTDLTVRFEKDADAEAQLDKTVRSTHGLTEPCSRFAVCELEAEAEHFSSLISEADNRPEERS